MWTLHEGLAMKKSHADIKTQRITPVTVVKVELASSGVCLNKCSLHAVAECACDALFCQLERFILKGKPSNIILFWEARIIYVI